MSLGAYLQCFRNDGKAGFAISKFREHYPIAPVRLVSDYGDEFNNISEIYYCSYVYEYYNLGVREGGYTADEMVIWLNRIKGAMEYCCTSHLLYMEDDVWVRDKINYEHIIIAGVQENHIPIQILDYFRTKYNTQFNADRYGTCGGAIYNCKVFLSLFSKILKIIDDDFEALSKYGFGYLDIFMPTVYMVLGIPYQLNHNMTESERNPNWGTSAHPIVHGKKIYG